jgi:hypothetical protein
VIEAAPASEACGTETEGRSDPYTVDGEQEEETLRLDSALRAGGGRSGC